MFEQTNNQWETLISSALTRLLERLKEENIDSEEINEIARFITKLGPSAHDTLSKLVIRVATNHERDIMKLLLELESWADKHDVESLKSLVMDIKERIHASK